MYFVIEYQGERKTVKAKATATVTEESSRVRLR
jgi:hypothetical protein